MQSSQLNENKVRLRRNFTFKAGPYQGEIRFVRSVYRDDRFELIFNGELLKSTKTFWPVERKMFLVIEEYRTYRPNVPDLEISREKRHREILRKLDRLVMV